MDENTNKPAIPAQTPPAYKSKPYMLLDAKKGVDKDTGEDVLRVTVAIPPSMVRMSVKISGDTAFPYTSEQIKARCNTGNFLHVTFQDLAIAKRKCGLGTIYTRLKETAEHSVALAVVVLNLRKLFRRPWRLLFEFFFLTRKFGFVQ